MSHCAEFCCLGYKPAGFLDIPELHVDGMHPHYAVFLYVRSVNTVCSASTAGIRHLNMGDRSLHSPPAVQHLPHGSALVFLFRFFPVFIFSFLCRPGDTLWLSPGEHEAQELAITWPLQLIGGGQRPEDTLIVSPKVC